MSEPLTNIVAARALLAKDATETTYLKGAIQVMDRIIASRWYRRVCDGRSEPSEIQSRRLAASLYIAHQSYVGNDTVLRRIRAEDQKWRDGYSKAMKHLREAERTAGLYSRVISVARDAMAKELKQAALFDPTALGLRGRASSDPKAQAKNFAIVMIDSVCPRRSIPDDEWLDIKKLGDELLRDIGFEIDPRGSSNARDVNKRKRKRK